MKRLLAYLFIGLGLAVNNFAFALELSSNRFISGKCIESNCVNGQGTYKDYYGAIYVGEWKDGKPHGQGTYTQTAASTSGKAKYVGGWKVGRYHGQGTYTDLYGAKYVGEFKDGIRDGQGTLTYAQGGIEYVGKWKDNKYHGQGTRTYPDGKIVEGIWNKNKLVKRNNTQTQIAKKELTQTQKVAKKKEKKKVAKKTEKDWKCRVLGLCQSEEKTQQVVKKEKKKVAKVVEQKQKEIKVKIKKKDTTGPIIEIAEAITVDDSSYTLKGKVSDKGSDKIYLKIDGEDIPIKRGKFKIERYSPVDEEIKIVAIDKWGNKSTKMVKVTIDIKEETVAEKLEPLNPSRAKGKTSGEKVALIIGIENYTEAPKANYANLDAKYFFDYARKAFGTKKQNINLLINEDATFVKTNKALTLWLRTKVKADQTDLIVFFAGHGLASSDGKELYLLPQDSDPNLLDITALSRTKLFQTIVDLKPKTVTMFLDTCYSGVSRDEQMLLASARPIRIVAGNEGEIPDNFTIFSATELDQISSGLKEAKHGIFSYYLMKGLEGKADTNKNKEITNGELLAYMDQNISQKASELGRQQNPSLTGNPDQVLMRYR